MFTFSGKLDSKGRITVPSRIRNRLQLEKGNRISLEIRSDRIVRKEVENEEEALQILSDFESVKSFQYSDDLLEVVLNG